MPSLLLGKIFTDQTKRINYSFIDLQIYFQLCKLFILISNYTNFNTQTNFGRSVLTLDDDWSKKKLKLPFTWVIYDLCLCIAVVCVSLQIMQNRLCYVCPSEKPGAVLTWNFKPGWWWWWWWWWRDPWFTWYPLYLRCLCEKDPYYNDRYINNHSSCKKAVSQTSQMRM